MRIRAVLVKHLLPPRPLAWAQRCTMDACPGMTEAAPENVKRELRQALGWGNPRYKETGYKIAELGPRSVPHGKCIPGSEMEYL